MNENIVFLKFEEELATWMTFPYITVEGTGKKVYIFRYSDINALVEKKVIGLFSSSSPLLSGDSHSTFSPGLATPAV